MYPVSEWIFLYFSDSPIIPSSDFMYPFCRWETEAEGDDSLPLWFAMNSFQYTSSDMRNVCILGSRHLVDTDRHLTAPFHVVIQRF